MDSGDGAVVRQYYVLSFCGTLYPDKYVKHIQILGGTTVRSTPLEFE